MSASNSETGVAKGNAELTLAQLVAQGRCEHCGTLGGIWHKLGCPEDHESAKAKAKERRAHRDAIFDAAWRE